MANDELQAMVRDELFWDPRVDSAAVAVSANDREVTYEHGEGEAPGAGVKASAGSASPDQRQSAAMGLLSPRSPTTGFVSDCHTGTLVAPGTYPNMTIIVSDGKTPVAAGAK